MSAQTAANDGAWQDESCQALRRRRPARFRAEREEFVAPYQTTWAAVSAWRCLSGP